MRIGFSGPLPYLPLALVLGCHRPGEPAVPDVWFQEVGRTAGIDFVHSFGLERRFWMPENVAGGLGWIDYDDDGVLDLYAVQAGDLKETTALGNRMFHNRGDGSFEDTTEATGTGDRGYGMGCAVGDYDGDGDADLFVSNLGPNVLYRNDAGTFQDVTVETGTGDPAWGTSSAFLDYDRDGDLDLFVTNYIYWAPDREIECSSAYQEHDYCSPRNYNAPSRDLLLNNGGDGTFEDVTRSAGLYRAFGNGLGVAPADYDANGYEDIYVANDLRPNFLWSNLGDGTFEDVALLAGCAVNMDGIAEAGMGVVPWDYQDDGDWDLFMTHLRSQTNTFYENRKGAFVDHTTQIGLATPSLEFTGFGVGFADFDQDGKDDVFISNGRVTASTPVYDPQDVYAEPNQLLRGLFPEGFQEIPDCGLGVPLYANTRGTAFADYDNDGDVDVALLNSGGRLHLLRNDAARGHWIQIRIRDRRGRDAYGAEVRIDTATGPRWRHVQTCYSFCSSNDPRVHVGLGGRADPVRVMVRWPDGQEEQFGPLEVDRLHVLRRGD